MDDDDYFIDGAFDNIKQSLSEIESIKYQSHNLAGICCLCLDESNKVIGDRFPEENYTSDFFNLRNFDNISGDKKEIIRTTILKKNIFPYFENEKRVVTSTLWNKIAYDYECLFLNYPVAVKRYVLGGMTDILLKLKIESPNYQIENCIVAINYSKRFFLGLTLIYSSILWKYWFFGGTFILSTIKFRRLPLIFLVFPIGFILFLKDLFKLKFYKSNE